MEKVAASQAAKLPGISVEKLNALEKKVLINEVKNTKGESVYSIQEIDKIKTTQKLVIAGEAEKVDAGILRSTAVSFSFFRKIFTVAGILAVVYLVLVAAIAILFIVYPLQTADFFGYYNPNNTMKQQDSSMIKGGRVLAATDSTSVITVDQTSVLADLLRPIAGTSLVIVKAIDNQKYNQIVASPADVPGFPEAGTEDLTGAAGADGANGADGLPGPQGPTGIGATGANGSNGTNGTNADEVLTSAGGIIMKSGSNVTVQLSPGSNGQVLTITSGIPAWENASASGSTAFSSLTSGTNTIASMVIGSGASLSTTGTGAITANAFSGLLPVANGGTGVSTLASNGVLYGNGTGVLTTSVPTSAQLLLGNASGVPTFTTLSGDAIISSSGLLTLKDTGTVGTYGSAVNVPVFTTDAQGRVTGVTNTAISGLTTSNLSASAGVTNGQLANSSITTAGNSGSGSVSLGGGLTFTGSGITDIIASGSTLTVTSTEADTLASVTGRGATTSTALTLSNVSNNITAGTLTVTGGTINGTTIGASTPSTGAFTTLSSTGTTNLGSETGTVSINSSGTTNIQVGGAGATGNVQIGEGGAGSATPDLLMLDIKNTSGDPTATNGAMYYNSSANMFRCFQNGAWTDCIGSSSSNTQILTKSTDQAVTSSTTLTDEASLQFAIAAGESWVFEYVLIVTNSSSAQPDWKSAIVGPAGSTCSVQLSGVEGAGGNFPQKASTDCTTPAAMTNTAIASDVGNGFNVWMQGIVTAGVTPGTVKMQFAQNTLSASALTVKAGSYVEAYKVSGADLAEAYSSKDATIVPGDVVTIDSSIVNGVKKSDKPYDASVLGIVSTNPGLVLGDSAISGIPVLVALSGRVPVRVSTENGAIKPGDFLTTSSKPGLAMKATKAGTIIGTAMTEYAGKGVGTVVVFVKNGSTLGSNSEGIDALMHLLNVSDSNSNSPLDIFQEVKTASNPTEPKESENTIEANLIGYIVRIVSDIFKDTVAFFGNVTFHENVTFMGRPTFNKDTAGHALIKKGDREVAIVFEKEYETRPVVTVNITLASGVSSDDIPSYAVYDVTTNGFQIKMSAAAEVDLRFSWIALSVFGENVSESVGSDTKIIDSTPSLTPSPLSSPNPVLQDITEVTEDISEQSESSESAQAVP